MFRTHHFGDKQVAEATSNDILVDSVEAAVDLLGNVYYQGYDILVLHKKHLSADFFNLKTKIAGEVLQKFSNYRMRLFILGDFQNITSQSLKDFIGESNQGNLVNFLNDLIEVQNVLERK